MAFEHISVLKNEVLENLTFSTSAPARLIDGTLGGGGHSFALLEKYPLLELLGIMPALQPIHGIRDGMLLQ